VRAVLFIIMLLPAVCFGQVATVDGDRVMLSGEPSAPVDFRALSAGVAGGWWVSDAFYVDAGACFEAGTTAIDVERSRCEGLLAVERKTCDGRIDIEDRHCAEKMALLASGSTSEPIWTQRWFVFGMGVATGIVVGVGAYLVADLAR